MGFNTDYDTDAACAAEAIAAGISLSDVLRAAVARGLPLVRAARP